MSNCLSASWLHIKKKKKEFRERLKNLTVRLQIDGKDEVRKMSPEYNYHCQCRVQEVWKWWQGAGYNACWGDGIYRWHHQCLWIYKTLDKDDSQSVRRGILEHDNDPQDAKKKKKKGKICLLTWAKIFVYHRERKQPTQETSFCVCSGQEVKSVT